MNYSAPDVLATAVCVWLQLGIAELPESLPPKPEEDEGFLKSVHDLVMDVSYLTGHYRPVYAAESPSLLIVCHTSFRKWTFRLVALSFADPHR